MVSAEEILKKQLEEERAKKLAEVERERIENVEKHKETRSEEFETEKQNLREKKAKNSKKFQEDQDKKLKEIDEAERTKKHGFSMKTYDVNESADKSLERKFREMRVKNENEKSQLNQASRDTSTKLDQIRDDLDKTLQQQQTEQMSVVKEQEELAEKLRVDMQKAEQERLAKEEETANVNLEKSWQLEKNVVAKKIEIYELEKQTMAETKSAIMSTYQDLSTLDIGNMKEKNIRDVIDKITQLGHTDNEVFNAFDGCRNALAIINASGNPDINDRNAADTNLLALNRLVSRLSDEISKTNRMLTRISDAEQRNDIIKSVKAIQIENNSLKECVSEFRSDLAAKRTSWPEERITAFKEIVMGVSKLIAEIPMLTSQFTESLEEMKKKYEGQQKVLE